MLPTHLVCILINWFNDITEGVAKQDGTILMVLGNTQQVTTDYAKYETHIRIIKIVLNEDYCSPCYAQFLRGLVHVIAQIL